MHSARNLPMITKKTPLNCSHDSTRAAHPFLCSFVSPIWLLRRHMTSGNEHGAGAAIPSAFVRTHLARLAKRRERSYYSHHAFTRCAVSSWQSEEVDERPKALLLTAAREPLGSC